MIDLVQNTMSNQKLNKPFHSFFILFICVRSYVLETILIKVFICLYVTMYPYCIVFVHVKVQF